MAREHFLINLHTPSKTNLPSELRLGEIAVRHNDEAPELLILKNNGEFATFVDKTFVTTITTSLSGEIDAIAGDVADLSGATVAGFVERYTKTEVDGHLANAIASGETAAADALADAKEYSDGKLSAATYTLSKSIDDVAGDVTELSGATVGLAGKAVTSIEITGTEDPNNTESQTVTAKIESNVAKFDFSKMIIDCGTF